MSVTSTGCRGRCEGSVGGHREGSVSAGGGRSANVRAGCEGGGNGRHAGAAWCVRTARAPPVALHTCGTVTCEGRCGVGGGGRSAAALAPAACRAAGCGTCTTRREPRPHVTSP
eukprot:938416-Prymnesium_polylepis.1